MWTFLSTDSMIFFHAFFASPIKDNDICQHFQHILLLNTIKSSLFCLLNHSPNHFLSQIKSYYGFTSALSPESMVVREDFMAARGSAYNRYG